MNIAEGPEIVSRFPIARRKVHRLPSCGHLTDLRVWLFAELVMPYGRIGVFSAHISEDPCHGQAVATLVWDSPGPLPAILMGDFNAEENSSVIKPLTRQGGLVDVFRRATPAAPGATVWSGARTAESTSGVGWTTCSCCRYRVTGRSPLKLGRRRLARPATRRERSQENSIGSARRSR